MAARENRFASELNEKEVIELLEDLSYILGALIIPLALVGCEMIISLYYIISYPTRARGIIVDS